jgi:hypothetical protein
MSFVGMTLVKESSSKLANDNSNFFMPPFKEEGHVALHLLVGMSVNRPHDVRSIS